LGLQKFDWMLIISTTRVWNPCFFNWNNMVYPKSLDLVVQNAIGLYKLHLCLVLMEWLVVYNLKADLQSTKCPFNGCPK